MESWGTVIAAVVTGLIIVALMGCLVIQNRNREAERARWKRMADQKYKEGRSEASQILRAAVDQIADDKNRIAGMTDRELMTEALMALAGLGRRMDRMEDSIRSFNQFEEMLASLTDEAEALSQNAGVLNRQVADVQSAASSFQSAVASTDEAVYSLSDSAHSMGSLLENISGQIDTLTGFSDSFSSLQDQVQTVIQRMNQAMRVNADNPAAAISQIDSRVTAIYQQLENLADGLNLMARSLEGVQETLDKVTIPAPGPLLPEDLL